MDGSSLAVDGGRGRQGAEVNCHSEVRWSGLGRSTLGGSGDRVRDTNSGRADLILYFMQFPLSEMYIMLAEIEYRLNFHKRLVKITRSKWWGRKEPALTLIYRT